MTFHIPRDPSQAKRGMERRRWLNELAGELERHINAELAAKDSGQIIYGYLAVELGVDLEDVREVMRRVPGSGQNGITIRKGAGPEVMGSGQ